MMQTSVILDKIPLGLIVFNEANEIISINGWGEEFIAKTSNYLLEIIRDMVKISLANNKSIQKIVRCSAHDEFFVWHIKTEFIQMQPAQIVIIIEDKTINTKLEQSILKAEKLAVIGYVAMGSLMEIRNPLTSARGFCRLIEDGDKVKKDYVEIISKELGQIQDIIEGYAAISEPSASNCLESIYHKFWTCINSQVLTYKLIMLTNSNDDSLIGHISEEQINAVLKLIKPLNIWTEESIYIINIEIKKESRFLKFNFASINGTHGDIYGASNLIKTINRYKIDNSQIDIQIINNEAINIELNFDAI